MHVLVPLAGQNRSFEYQGLPKPLTVVSGKPIIQLIAESRPYSFTKAIFIVLKVHQEKHLISDRLKEMFGKDITIIEVGEPTKGPAESALLAREIINTDEPLLIDQADQYLDLPGFMDFIQDKKADGVIPTFESFYPHRRYMALDGGKATAISEKDPIPISTHCASCISFFRKGNDFVQAADNAIAKQRTAINGSYAIHLAYNEMIEAEKNIIPFSCDFITSFEDPAALAGFEEHIRPLKCGKEVFSRRVSESPVFQFRGKRPRPENSLSSIRNAMNFGFSFSVDIRMSKDGILILSSEDEIAGSKISETPASSLAQLYLDKSDEHPSTFDEALDLLDKKAYGVMAIHLEDPTMEMIRSICSKLLIKRMENRTFLFGLNPGQSLIKKAYPAIKTGLLIVAEDFKGVPPDMDVIWVSERKKGGIDSTIRAAARKAGALSIAISPELVNPKATKKEASTRSKELFAMGYDGVCTSYF